MDKIIVTTTDQIEGHRITKYKGLISFRAWAQLNRIFVGDPNGGKEIEKYRDFWKAAEDGLRAEASAIGANAVIGVRAFPPVGGMAATVILTGTAVIIE